MSQLRTPLVITLTALVLLELLVFVRYHRGPLPTGETPADAFSADRAMAVHRSLIPDEPHPAGSPQNAVLRDRLVEHLTANGWQVQQQRATVTSRSGDPVDIVNLLAGRPESSQRDARPLVLATHYDSCRFGPGAGDAGMCVAAILEAAEVLTTFAERWQRPLWLLITDAEEEGLLGATEFVRSHPLARERPYVVNLDARGTAGPVVMYETHFGNLPAVQQWADALASPRVTGSLFAAVYRTMPNGTDFSVFANNGWQGFNLAVIDGAHHYHQPTDTRENLDPRSIQHFGRHLCSLGQTILTSGDPLPETRENAVFFDVLGGPVVRYPVRWSATLGIALVIATLWLSGGHVFARGRRRGTALILLGLLASLVAATVTGWLFSRSIAGTDLLPRPFVSWGHFLSITLTGLTAVVALGVQSAFVRHGDPHHCWHAVWVGVSIVALAATVVAPEFSHLFLVPGGLALLLTACVRSIPARSVLAVVGTAVLWLPTLHLLSIALGPTSGLMLGAVCGMTLIPVMPQLARGRSAGNTQRQAPASPDAEPAGRTGSATAPHSDDAA